MSDIIHGGDVKAGPCQQGRVAAAALPPAAHHVPAHCGAFAHFQGVPRQCALKRWHASEAHAAGDARWVDATARQGTATEPTYAPIAAWRAADPAIAHVDAIHPDDAGVRAELERLKAARSQRVATNRAAIDALLREDARSAPAFAVARRAAVLAAAEYCPSLTLREAAEVTAACLTYEEKRGGMARPRKEATDFAAGWALTMQSAIGAYERARGCR